MADLIGKDKYGLKLFVERGWDGDVIITRDAWAEDRSKVVAITPVEMDALCEWWQKQKEQD